MIRILGQTCPDFWCMWTRKLEPQGPGCSHPSPREFSSKTEQACRCGWTELRPWLAPLNCWTNRPWNCCFQIIFFYICQEILIKAIGARVLFIIKILMNQHGLDHQTGKHPECPSPSGRVPSSGGFSLQMMNQVTTFQSISIGPLHTWELLNYLKISECEDTKLIFP